MRQRREWYFVLATSLAVIQQQKFQESCLKLGIIEANGLTIFRFSRRATLPELQEWSFVCCASFQRLLKSDWVGDEFSLSKVSSVVKVRHFYSLKAPGNLAILNEVYTELFTNQFVIANFLSIWFIKAISEPFMTFKSSFYTT